MRIVKVRKKLRKLGRVRQEININGSSEERISHLLYSKRKNRLGIPLTENLKQMPQIIMNVVQDAWLKLG
jgi:hypothetical protein